MKITAFYPTLLTKNSNTVVEKMKKLGFEVIHETKDLINNVNHEYAMQDKNGYRFDVVHTNVLEDEYAIRINVDNLDEAIKTHEELGFKVFMGPETTESSKRALIESPEGLKTYLIEHIK